MSPGDDNQVDWTAAAVPEGERVGPGLSRKPPRTGPQGRSKVMDTLLGEHELIALDSSGGDPYNATGRLFRR